MTQLHPLLMWIAEEGGGRISHLRQLAINYVRTVENNVPFKVSSRWLTELENLGLVDLDWGSDRWRTASMQLVELPGRFPFAVLRGAQKHQFVAQLESSGLDFTAVTNGEFGWSLPLPETFVAQFDDVHQLVSAADALGAAYVGVVVSQMKELIETLSLGSPASGPSSIGTPLEHFEHSAIAFVASPPGKLPSGLYRQKTNGRWRHWISRGNEWYSIDRDAGICLELGRANTSYLTWRPYKTDPGIGELIVAPGVVLPASHTKLAILCSGFRGRKYELTRATAYDNVPREVATAIASAHAQTLD